MCEGQLCVNKGVFEDVSVCVCDTKREKECACVCVCVLKVNEFVFLRERE